MADQRQLKDAKITVTIDTSAAERALDDRGRGKDDRSVPGSRPPQPGKRNEEDRRRDDDRDRRPKRPGVSPVVGAAAIPGAGRAIIAAVKTFAAAFILKTVAETVPGMIEQRLKSLDPATRAAAELTQIPQMVSGAFEGIGSAFRGMEIAAGIIGPGKRAAGDLARSQQALRGNVDMGSIARIALREAKRASVEVSLNALRREQGRRFGGAAFVDFTDQARALMLPGVYR